MGVIQLVLAFKPLRLMEGGFGTFPDGVIEVQKGVRQVFMIIAYVMVQSGQLQEKNFSFRCHARILQDSVEPAEA